jgi:N-acetyl-gamma-glutamyl-phosphate reductase
MNSTLPTLLPSHPITVGVVGASGYSGQEALRLLVGHPAVRIGFVAARSHAGQPFSSLYPAFKGVLDAPCLGDDEWPTQAPQVDALLLALPHGLAASQVQPHWLAQGLKAIDLSGDFRLPTPELYATWYEQPHPQPQLLPQAVYGLSEWVPPSQWASTQLVANPGCYPTCTLLPLLPLLQAGALDTSVPLVVDAKSGVSGAGRGLSLGVHYAEANESTKAYKVEGHRHIPEMESHLQGLAGLPSPLPPLSFVPHLLPLNRGMLVTTYAQLKPEWLQTGVGGDRPWQRLRAVFEAAYAHQPFVHLCTQQESQVPEVRWVRGSNRCAMGWHVCQRTGRVVLVSVLDNLLKGAAGQAVQNLNLLFGLPQTLGLEALALLP